VNLSLEKSIKNVTIITRVLNDLYVKKKLDVKLYMKNSLSLTPFIKTI